MTHCVFHLHRLGEHLTLHCYCSSLNSALSLIFEGSAVSCETIGLSVVVLRRSLNCSNIFSRNSTSFLASGVISSQGGRTVKIQLNYSLPT